MGNGKAYNSFTDAHKVEGVNVNPQLNEKLADMICPEIPTHGDKPNFWKSSCKIKQQMEEHEKTCYPYCKNIKADIPPERRKRDTRPLASDYARSVGKRVVELYHQGLTRDQIAKEVCRGKETVSKRLREAGICNPRRFNTLRERMFKYLEEHPETTAIELHKIFNSARSTAEGYKKEFNRGARA